MIKACFIILLLVATCACTNNTTFVRSAPNYSGSLVKARVALLLPPDIEVNQIDALNKKTRVYNYEDRLEEIMVDTFITTMHDKGYNIKLLSRPEIGINKLSHYAVDTKDEFKDIAKILYAGGAWSEDKAYSIDYKIPAAVELGKKMGGDLLIVMNFYSENKTSAAITKDLTTDILKGALFAVATGRTTTTNTEPAEFSIVRLAILDASNGQILWAHSVSISNDIISTTTDSFSDANKVDKKKLSTLINSALIDLPSAK